MNRTYSLKANLPSKMDYTVFIPEEIWIKIASYLSQQELCSLSLVSRRFLRISRDPILWQTIKLLGDAISETETVVSLLERCSLLTELSIVCRDDVIQLLHTVAQSCKKMKILRVQRCPPLNYTDLELLSTNCTEIECLNLDSTGCLNLNADAHWMEGCTPCTCPPSGSFTNLLANFNNLSFLDLFHCRNLNNRGLEQIAEFCPKLTYINIDEVQYLSDDSVKYFISRLKNTLKHFVIDGETLTDESFASFGDLKALIDLRISFCDNMESNGFLAISELSNLEWLKLRRAGNLLPQDFTLAFSDHKLKNLLHLDLSECATLSDDGLISISKNCPRLGHLILCWCWELTDRSLCRVVENCRLLMEVNLCGVVRLTGDFLEDIPSKMLGLQSLNLEQVPNIDVHQILDLLEWNPRLYIKDYYGEQVYPINCLENLLLSSNASHLEDI